MTEISKEIIKTIIEDRANEVPQVETMKKTGVTKWRYRLIIEELKKQGRIDKIAPSVHREFISEEKYEMIRVLWLEGKPNSYISEQTGIKETSLNNYINNLKDAGKLPRNKPMSPERKKMRRAMRVAKCEPTGDCEPVKCCCAVSKKCIYGYKTPIAANGICRYSLVTGKCRSVTKGDFIGCPPEACTKFVKIDRNHPRQEVEEE